MPIARAFEIDLPVFQKIEGKGRSARQNCPETVEGERGQEKQCEN